MSFLKTNLLFLRNTGLFIDNLGIYANTDKIAIGNTQYNYYLLQDNRKWMFLQTFYHPAIKQMARQSMAG